MTDRQEALRKRIVDILGLETDPFGDPDHLLTYDEQGNVQDGVDYSGEVELLVQLITEAEVAARIDELEKLDKATTLTQSENDEQGLRHYPYRVYRCIQSRQAALQHQPGREANDAAND